MLFVKDERRRPRTGVYGSMDVYLGVVGSGCEGFSFCGGYARKEYEGKSIGGATLVDLVRVRVDDM